MTISRKLAPSEKSAAQAKLRELQDALSAPCGGTDAMAEIARMMAGFSVTSNLTEAQSEAKALVYGDAIDDLPAWAIVAARKAWARGETANLKGKVDPTFPPAPAHVRALALEAMAVPMCEASRLRALLDAEVATALPDEHRRAMLQRMSGMMGSAAAPKMQGMPKPPREMNEAERAARLAAMAQAVQGG